MKFHPAYFLTASLMAVLPLHTTEGASLSPSFEQDGIKVQFDKRNGYAIFVDGMPFSGGSQLALTNPAWTESYYTYAADTDLPRQLLESQKIAQGTGNHFSAVTSQSSSVAVSTQTIEILPGRRLRFTLDVEKTTAAAVLLENRIASVSEGWLANRPFRAQLRDGHTTSGKIFAWAPSANPADSTVAPGFQSIQIDSPHGLLGIHTTSTATITLMDYRKNEWAGGERYFWLGVLGTQIPEAGLRYQLTFDFPPTQDAAPVPPITARPAVIKNQPIYQAANPPDIVLPTPKSLGWSDVNLEIGKELIIATVETDQQHTANGGELAAGAAGEVIRHFAPRWREKFGLRLTSAPASKSSTATCEFERNWDLPPAQADEAYSLSITDSDLRINVRSATGLRNALATLEQLIRRRPDGTLSLRGVNITDYPALPFRGIHFFSGRNAAALQQKMLNDILAPLKINKLIYQVDYLEWDTLPAPHHASYSMSKGEAKQVADTAASAGMEVIPLVNTFGHSEWLLERPAMAHLADDPEHPYAYDPSNPEVYRICEGIYDETIALFHPRTIHIGHDEVTMNGFPKKPANVAVGATELLIRDTLHYHTYLAEKGIRTMIWGDMFLGPGESPDACLAPTVAEARRRRGLLPRDIMIADWHYRPAAPEDYKSLSIFADAGFETIACTWNQARNITNFAQAAATAHRETTAALGLMQTTWAGYSFDQSSLENSFDQYAAYVLAAEAAWTGDAAETADLDYQAEFLRRWTHPPAEVSDGWQLNLTGLAKVPLTDATADSLGLGRGAFGGLLARVNELGGYHFRLAEARGGVPGAVITSSPLTLEVDGAAGNEIMLAMATSRAVPDGYKVGQITVRADDGTSVSTALVYGKNVFTLADPRQNLESQAVWQSAGLEPDRGAAVMHLLRVKTPAGGRVRSLELRPATGTELVLLAVSGS